MSRTAPVGSFESRMSTLGHECAISTQLPSGLLEKLLFLQVSIEFALRSVKVACHGGKEFD